ncbi:MAG: alpha/beta hydrolase [Bauldia sp.]|nr:alpha/beta hydrolase [Bauldia sp.]
MSMQETESAIREANASGRRPVLFVHGLWLHTSSWGAWVDHFREAGYAPLAPGWPGFPDTVEECNQRPELIAGKGVNEVTAHYTGIAGRLSQKPVAVGHSFGGLIVQKLLGEEAVAAAVALDPAPIKGVLPLAFSQLRSAFPVLKNPLNVNKAVPLTRKQFRYAFGNTVSEAESDALYQRWAIPAPGKPLFSGAVANFNPNSPTKVNTRNATRGPLLLTSGGKDHVIPPVTVKVTQWLYRKSPAITERIDFPDRGHSLGIDSRWQEVADKCLAWLRKQGF